MTNALQFLDGLRDNMTLGKTTMARMRRIFYVDVQNRTVTDSVYDEAGIRLLVFPDPNLPMPILSPRHAATVG